MSERSESNGGGGIRSPEGAVTHGEHHTYKTAPEPPQKATDGVFECGGGEQKCDTSEHVSDSVLHPKCATGVPRERGDRDLTRLIEAWPQLSADTRVAILRIGGIL
jgi:hypothetical protein